jgi:glucose/arabinose dehydrogenase
MRRLFAVAAVAASCVTTTSALSMGIMHASAALPGGFVDVQVPNPPGNALNSPTSITPLAGGRALILEKTGAVRIMNNAGALLAADALTLDVCTGSEMGLLGAAVDPAFIVNGFVYLFYTRNAGDCASSTGRFGRVSRFTMSGDTIIPSSETVLLDNIAARGGNHNGGDLEVGQDGYLSVSIGDSGQNPRGTADTAAEDPSLLNGKILRITTAGGIPPDNPFVGDPNGASCATAGISMPTSRKCLEIYDWGLRNPYRFAFDTNTGATRFFINDVGQGTWEEVDQGGAGLNYGWNNREGFCDNGSTTSCPPTPAGFTDPLTAYPHSSGCTYITGGTFVPNGVWPKQFDGSYLFADGGCGKVWQRTAAGAVDYGTPFATTSGVIVDMAFVTAGADPSLYYVTNGSSQLRRITYDAPPSAHASALSYSPLPTANRASDTRVGAGSGPMRAGTTRYVDLGIHDSNVQAALVNLTMVDSSGNGYVVASEGRTEHPSTSNLNVATGEVAANTSIVPVDADGNIVLFASVTTHVIVDVLGTFRASGPGQSGGRFTALAPARLIDTRLPIDAVDNAYTKSATVNFASKVNTVVGGKLGVPSAVQAVALIVTGVTRPGTSPGFATVYPGGASQPFTSNLNTNGNGDARPNLVVVPLGVNGSIDITLQSTDDVIVDVAGYFLDTSAAGGLFHVVAPTRQVDSRLPLGFGTLAIDATATLDPGPPVPNNAIAVAQNVTLTNGLGGGYLTAYPSDQSRPLASNANVSGPRQDHASLTLTKVGANGAGSIAYYSSGGTDVVVDITGYFDGAS